jgi:valine--pyruvate aminotransferase
MKPHLTQIGEKMTELTGVRSIMKDIKETQETRVGEHAINLSAGNPLILPEIDSLWRKYTRELLESDSFSNIVGRYGSSQGYEELINAIVHLFNSKYGWKITSQNVLITPGSQSFYFLATNMFGGVDKEGNLRSIVLPLCPDYTGYQGVTLSKTVLKSYKPEIEILEPHRFKYKPNFDKLQLDETIGALLLSRPNNPSGNVLTEKELNQMINLCESLDIPILIDSAYAPPFPNLMFTEMKPVWHKNIIYCLSMSKVGLPGERIGIAIGHESYIRELESFQSNLSIHSSRLGQAIAAKAINSGELVHLSNTIIKPYYLNRFKTLETALDREMPDVSWYLHKGEGSIFGWLWFKDLPVTDLELYLKLKEERVIVAPGSPFFPGLNEDWPHKNQCIRISLTGTNEEIERVVTILSKVIKQVYKVDNLRVNT